MTQNLYHTNVCVCVCVCTFIGLKERKTLTVALANLLGSHQGLPRVHDCLHIPHSYHSVLVSPQGRVLSVCVCKRERETERQRETERERERRKKRRRRKRRKCVGGSTGKSGRK